MPKFKMFSVILLKSFCGYSLKFGCICVLCCLMVIQIVRIILAFQTNESSFLNNLHIIWMLLEITSIAVAFGVVNKRRPDLMIPYMVVQAIDLILYIYYGYYIVVKNSEETKGWVLIDTILFYSLAWTISFLGLATVHSYYMELLEDDSVQIFMLRYV